MEIRRQETIIASVNTFCAQCFMYIFSFISNYYSTKNKFYYHFSFEGAQKVSNTPKVMDQIKRHDLDLDPGLADAESILSSLLHARLMCDSICDVEIFTEKGSHFLNEIRLILISNFQR